MIFAVKLILLTFKNYNYAYNCQCNNVDEGDRKKTQ